MHSTKQIIPDYVKSQPHSSTVVPIFFNHSRKGVLWDEDQKLTKLAL